MFLIQMWSACIHLSQKFNGERPLPLSSHQQVICCLSHLMNLVSSCLTRREPASEGAADHHQAAVHAGEQTGAHRRTGETGGGPDAGPQVPAQPD